MLLKLISLLSIGASISVRACSPDGGPAAGDIGTIDVSLQPSGQWSSPLGGTAADVATAESRIEADIYLAVFQALQNNKVLVVIKEITYDFGGTLPLPAVVDPAIIPDPATKTCTGAAGNGIDPDNLIVICEGTMSPFTLTGAYQSEGTITIELMTPIDTTLFEDVLAEALDNLKSTGKAIPRGTAEFHVSV